MNKEITSLSLYKKLITLFISIILLVSFLALGINKIIIIDRIYVIFAIVISILAASYIFIFKFYQINSKQRYLYYQILDFFVMLNFALFIIQIFFMAAFFPATVYKSSMYPTLKEHDQLLVLSTERIDRFNIIVLQVNNEYNKLPFGINDKELIVKRVIAIGGDTFYYKDGNLYLNDELINEQYLKDEYGNFINDGGFYGSYTQDFYLKDYCFIKDDNQCTPDEVCRIPDGYLFVLGDNRRSSIDSREMGLFHSSQIVGVVRYKKVSLFKWVTL